MNRAEGRTLVIAMAQEFARQDRGLRRGSRVTQHTAFHLTQRAALRAGVHTSDAILRQWAPDVAAAYLEEFSA